jgi:hypothetical protein
MIRCCSGIFFATMQVLVVCFPNLRYFFPQLGDALFEGLLHGDRLAEDMIAQRNTSDEGNRLF